MAIDPSIALGIRPIQLPDPVESYGKGLSLRNLVQQQQLGAEQIRGAQMENQARELDLQDQQSLRQLYSEAGGDLEKLQKLAAGRVGPKAMTALNNAVLETREKLGKIKETELKNLHEQNQAIGAAAQSILGLPPEQRPQAYAEARARLLSQGYITADHAPEQYPGDDFITMQAHQALTADQQFQQEMKRREVAATEKNAATSAARLNAEMPGIQSGNLLKGLQAAAQTVPNNQADWDTWRAGLAPDIQSKVPAMYSPTAAEAVVGMGIAPAEKKQIEGAAEGRAETKRHNAVEEQQGAARVAVSREEQALRQKQFDATYGALVGPDGKPLEGEAAKAVAQQDPLAVAVANYQAPPPATSRGGPGASIMRKVLAINPDYQAQNWQAQGGVLKDFTSGNTSKSLVAMSTALGHLGELDQAAEALKSGDVRLLNSIAQRIGAAVGNDAATTFKTIVHRVGPEIEKAYVGGAGTGGERGKTEADFDPAMGYQQLKSNIAESAKLFRSKIGAEEYRWKQVMGTRPMPFVLTPEAEATMQRISGGTGEGGRGGAPQPTASYAVTATGKDGHKIGTNDGGKTWYDVQTGKKI